MKLSVTLSGPAGPLPPVLVTHGLFGQARNLGVVIRTLSASRQVLAVDLRNHGDSPWDDRHDYDALADDLAQVIRRHGGIADVVGHSMGGKAAMWLALNHGGLVRRLVVLDIAPVAYGHSQAHLIDAMEGLDLTALTTRSEADRRLSAGVGDAGVRSFLLQSLDLKSAPPQWRLNLGALRAHMDELTGWPGHGDRHWDGPALAVAGGDSDYIDAEGEAALRQAFPSIRIERIEGGGHWVHAEKSAAVTTLIADFLG